MNEPEIYLRYQQMQRYVGWRPTDAAQLLRAGELVKGSISGLIDDFYEEIERHPATRKVITGGAAQVNHLKSMLQGWLTDLFEGPADSQYAVGRWKVGWRHVEIGLPQVYVNAALARLRGGIINSIHQQWNGSLSEFHELCAAVHRALDLDLALIQDAYETEKRVRSENVFRSLIEAAGCAILILREDFTLVYVNPYTERLSGYRLRNLRGHSAFQKLFSVPTKRAILRHWQTLKTEGDSGELELPLETQQGLPRRLVWNARWLHDFDGESAILAVGHDITELKQAQERSLQAERLAAIGQTVAGLAHESRNAFQRMQACLEMLSLEVAQQPEALELVQRIQRAESHLHHLYEEVRSYAAPVIIDRQVCDMSRLLGDVWHELQENWQPKQIRLECQPPAAEMPCRADPFAIQQAIRNVLENAIAASPPRGTIRAFFSKEPDPPPGMLVLAIRDEGPGMDDHVLPQVFAPFFTTKTRGTGLGMAIAKRIVDAHGGQITAANHTCGGAEFRLQLPCSP